MTLRQFVELGTVGTRAEREQFETGMLRAGADAVAHGLSAPCDADCASWLWELAFEQFVKWGLLR